MLAFTDSNDKQSPTIIGAGCNLTGDIDTTNIVQIHGTVKGNIIANTVVIGLGGSVTGTIKAQTLFLHGNLNGDANVNIANIFNKAKMIGTLTYRTLNINGNTGLECKLAKQEG